MEAWSADRAWSCSHNVNLAFDFGQTLPGLSMDFGEYGGNLNMTSTATSATLITLQI